jgi:hypothetical protein
MVSPMEGRGRVRCAVSGTRTSLEEARVEARARRYMTFDEYLAIEVETGVKHEYLNVEHPWTTFPR